MKWCSAGPFPAANEGWRPYCALRHFPQLATEGTGIAHIGRPVIAKLPRGLPIRPIVGRKDHKESLLSGYLNAAIVVEMDL